MAVEYDIFREMFAAGTQVTCDACGKPWIGGHRCLDIPLLTFNKDEWRMAIQGMLDTKAALDRRDDIMTATREIARGG